MAAKFWLKTDEDLDGVAWKAGPYPTYKMAEFMKGTYDALFQRNYKVVEVNE